MSWYFEFHFPYARPLLFVTGMSHIVMLFISRVLTKYFEPKFGSTNSKQQKSIHHSVIGFYALLHWQRQAYKDMITKWPVLIWHYITTIGVNSLTFVKWVSEPSRYQFWKWSLLHSITWMPPRQGIELFTLSNHSGKFRAGVMVAFCQCLPRPH